MGLSDSTVSKGMVAFMAAWLIFWLACIVGLVIVVVHFIHKAW